MLDNAQLVMNCLDDYHSGYFKYTRGLSWYKPISHTVKSLIEVLYWLISCVDGLKNDIDFNLLTNEMTKHLLIVLMAAVAINLLFQ